MKIQTKLAPRFWLRKLLLALTFCTLASLFWFLNLPFPNPGLQPLFGALCVIAAGIFIFTWIQAARKKYTLLENGTLETPTGAINSQQMKSIQMLAWDQRRIAKLDFQAAPPAKGQKSPALASIKLDGWIHAHMDEIIITLNDRLNPTPAPTPVPADADTDSTSS